VVSLRRCRCTLVKLGWNANETVIAWVEHRHCSILYHYKNAENPQAAARQAGDCTNHINDSCESQRVHAIPVDGAVLVESMDWSKGTAASQVLERLKQKKDRMPDFLMVAGDDREDEPIFRWANALGKDKAIESVITVSVGSRNTEAISTLMQGVTGKWAVLPLCGPIKSSPIA